MDGLSFLLILITFWILSICTNLEGGTFSSFLTMFSMLFLLVMSFMTVNFFLFFIFFEIVFILMFVYLYSMGNSPERIQASFYMFFYTMVFSLPFLLGLISFSLFGYSSFFSLSFLNTYDFFWVFIFMVFAVKLPLYGVHLWLPKAHVQASVTGSMILAGILLKLGGYGIIRFFYLVDVNSLTMYFFDFLFYLSLYGGMIMTFVCIRQSDLKMLIAYSSVVHMSVMFLGLLSFSLKGLYGSIMMMISHGFISPMMFYLMTHIYSVNHSRSIYVLKGFITSSPIFCLWWFLCCSLNLSLPPFMSFFSEICILGSLSFINFYSMIIIILSLFFTGVYCIYSYVIPTHGSSSFINSSNFYVSSMMLSFFLCSFVLFFPFLFF